MKKGIFIGSFDPWHNGHKDRLINALKIFDHVVIVIANNYDKKTWFSQEERKEMIIDSLENPTEHIEIIIGGNKMIHEIIHELQIFNVFRGVKATRTIDDEIRLQNFCRHLLKDEYGEDAFFVYDITSDSDFRGSSLIKELCLNNQNIEKYVSSNVVEKIKARAIEIKNK